MWWHFSKCLRSRSKGFLLHLVCCWFDNTEPVQKKEEIHREQLIWKISEPTVWDALRIIVWWARSFWSEPNTLKCSGPREVQREAARPTPRALLPFEAWSIRTSQSTLLRRPWSVIQEKEGALQGKSISRSPNDWLCCLECDVLKIPNSWLSPSGAGF